MHSRLKLEGKLALLTGTFLVLTVCCALAVHLRLRENNRLSDTFIQVRLPVILAVRDLRREMSRSVEAVERGVLFGDRAQALDRYRTMQAEHMANAVTLLTSVENAPWTKFSAPDQITLDQLRQELDRMKDAEAEVNRLLISDRKSDRASARLALETHVLVSEWKLYELCTALSDSTRRQADEEAGRIQQVNRVTLIQVWSTATIIILLCSIGPVLFGRHIGHAIGRLVARANSIASGDLTGEPLAIDRYDQVGTLAQATNSMQASLSRLIGTVVHTVSSLSGSALTMQSASDGIHRRMDQQSQQTQQAASALQEMSASIAEVSRHTQSAAETARAAAQTARDGGTIVKLMLSSMQEISVAVRETSSTVSMLGEDSRRVSQIVTVIDDIARKTNLLALNAAIEAARAGEQGRGFAVVAGEVRRLAESTTRANSEIGVMVTDIQDRTRIAIASMGTGNALAQQGLVTTTQAGDALQNIIGMAERVDRMIAQIAIAASQQAVAADQSSASLESIYSLSNDNLREMTTTAAGIDCLRETAETLKAQVERFQLSATATVFTERRSSPAMYPAQASLVQQG